MNLEHSGETYWKHWKEANKVLWTLLIFSLKIKIHMWIPVLFVTDVSEGIKDLNEKLQGRLND